MGSPLSARNRDQGTTHELLTSEQIASITEFTDITAAPPDESGAVFIFGTNQPVPVHLAADRYRRGLAPLIIVTGGVNRHDGTIEGREFYRFLRGQGVKSDAIRVEDASANTWQNVEFALTYLSEAVEQDLPVTAITKWYHRRAAHILRTRVPELEQFHVITFEPVYAGIPITRANWPQHPEGRRRVIREWEECSRRVADGSFLPLERTEDGWQ